MLLLPRIENVSHEQWDVRDFHVDLRFSAQAAQGNGSFTSSAMELDVVLCRTAVVMFDSV